MHAERYRTRTVTHRLARTAVLCALLAGATVTAHAASASRILGAGLVIVGAGLRMGGIVTGSDASEAYDSYLMTADQGLLATIKDDYQSKRDLSKGLSGAGDGLIIAGALLATMSVLRSGSDGTAEVARLESPLRWSPTNQAFALVWNRHF